MSFSHDELETPEFKKFLAAQQRIDSLESEDRANLSDGYHTFAELYEARCVLTAALFNLITDIDDCLVCKSWRHFDGELCFGGGWFIVQAKLSTGQISFHYPAKDWDRFSIPELPQAWEWDGHTTQDVYDRLLSI